MPERETIKETTRESARDTKWHEWTSSVLSQLVDINTRYEALSRQITSRHEALDSEMIEKFDSLTEKLNRVSHLISGSSDPSKGLVIRVDRLEQSEGRRNWWLKSTIAACVGAIITAVFALIKKHP